MSDERFADRHLANENEPYNPNILLCEGLDSENLSIVSENWSM